MRELSENQRECAGLITTLIEDELTEEQRDRLNELCRQDPACRKLYAAVMSVHGMLLWSNELAAKDQEEMDESSAFLMEVFQEARVRSIKLDAEVELARNLKAQKLEAQQQRLRLQGTKTGKRPRILIIPKAAVYSGLAAAILLAMVLLWPVLQPNGSTGPDIAEEVPEIVPEAVLQAQLVRSQDAVWNRSISAVGVLSGDDAWLLKEGFAEIAMPSGASVILQGPTTFRLIDGNTLALDGGQLTAEVPDRAKYFTVKTRSMDVVDLGTRFGVRVEADGAVSTSVFEGKVEAHAVAAGADSPRIVALTAGQQMHADASGKLDETVSTVEPDHGYVARWGMVEQLKRHVRVQGQARFFATPPKSVQQGELVDADNLIVFEESTVVLDQPLEAWFSLPVKTTATFVTIPKGRRVVSYFLHFDPNKQGQYVSATLTFPGRILGVVGGERELRKSNALFGLDSVDYVGNGPITTHSIDPNTPDTFAIGGLQGDVLTLRLGAAFLSDQCRVIVELPDPFGDAQD